MNKQLIQISIIFILCLGFGLASFAHVGHQHPNTKKEANPFSEIMKDYKVSLNSNGNHLGHFYINKVKKSGKNDYRLRIKQTFHLNSDETKTLNAKYNAQNNLTEYSFKTSSGDEYFIYINLEDLEGGENNGLRVTFTNSESEKLLSSESLNVFVISPEDSESMPHEHN